jgi:flagellar FliJ protein
MSSTPFQLQPLLELSALRLDEATRKLGELVASEQETTRRHTLLMQYRAEYQARFMAAAQAGLSPQVWNNYRQLLDRIDEAVAQAALAVAQSQQRTLAGQQNWLGKQGRVKAFETLAQRHQTQQIHQELRQEQKLSDEFSARPRDRDNTGDE